MRKRFGTGVAILFVLSPPAWAAETGIHACSLLTSAEIAAGLGANVGEGKESDLVVPKGPQQGATTANCMWSVTDRGMFSVSVIRAPEGAARDAGIASLRQTFEALEARGWKQERKEGIAGCSILRPPAAEKSMPISTGCLAEAKGMGISASALGTRAEAIEAVKALLDKAIARLP
jgi:hypothetical protein